MFVLLSTIRMKSNADFLFTFAYFHYSIGKRKQAKVKRKFTFRFIRIVDYISFLARNSTFFVIKIIHVDKELMN